MSEYVVRRLHTRCVPEAIWKDNLEKRRPYGICEGRRSTDALAHALLRGFEKLFSV